MLMQALRSDLNTNAKNLEKRLLNLLQSMGSLYCLHSAQLWYLFSMQQVRILHHDALSFFAHPLHFPFKYDWHEPQYKPQYAICFMSGISC